MIADALSASAFDQQKEKLKPEAMEALFNDFNLSVSSISSTDIDKKFRSIAVDGSIVSFFCRPARDTKAYFISESHSVKGFFISSP